MNKNSPKPIRAGQSGRSSGPQRKFLSVFCVLLVVGVVVAAIGHQMLTRSPQETPATTPAVQTDTAADEPSSAVVSDVENDRPDRNRRSGEAHSVTDRPGYRSRINRPGSAQAAEEFPDTSVRALQLIGRLSQIDAGQGAITPERAKELKQNFRELAAQGAAAIPAIRQFLEKNQDFSFDDAAGMNAVGYASLRAGLLDTMKQIGGAESTELFLRTIQTTADPAEIALIARYLDEQSPGQHRQDAANAARETLQLLSQGQLKVEDAAPLFEVLQAYGDAGVTADLEKAMSRWYYYATMALTGLPEGQGVPALIQQLQNRTTEEIDRKVFTLQMLAQISSQYPEARAALIAQARSQQIPDSAWRRIAVGLAGDQYYLGTRPNPASFPGKLSGMKTYHIVAGNQNFYSLPLALDLPTDQISQRLALIDQLRALSLSPAAAGALQNARDLIVR